MATVYPEGVWRVKVTATKVTGDPQVSPIVMIPEGVENITVYVVGSTAAAGKVEESPSAAAEILTPSGDLWMAVDASLNSVGATLVPFELGTRTVMALRLTALLADQTATMTVIGRRVS